MKQNYEGVTFPVKTIFYPLSTAIPRGLTA